jgi:hypothetical protein
MGFRGSPVQIRPSRLEVNERSHWHLAGGTLTAFRGGWGQVCDSFGNCYPIEPPRGGEDILSHPHICRRRGGRVPLEVQREIRVGAHPEAVAADVDDVAAGSCSKSKSSSNEKPDSASRSARSSVVAGTSLGCPARRRSNVARMCIGASRWGGRSTTTTIRPG